MAGNRGIPDQSETPVAEILKQGVRRWPLAGRVVIIRPVRKTTHEQIRIAVPVNVSPSRTVSQEALQRFEQVRLLGHILEADPGRRDRPAQEGARRMSEDQD